jgi:tetratricopeptide (TPR) repeat protein/DNA-binding CsgD family transcriptional regulator
MANAASAGKDAGIESAIAEGLDAYRRNYLESLQIFSRLAPLMGKVRDRVLRAKVATYTGACHEGLGNFQAALDHYAEALRLSRESRHEGNEAVILFNTGIVYNRMGRFAEALELFSRSLELHQRLGNTGKLWSVWSVLGRTYCELGRFGDAIDAMERAIHIAREMGDERKQAEVRSVVATIYSDIHQTLGDASFRAELLPAAREGEGFLDGRILAAVGEMEAQSGDYDQALEHLLRSLGIHRALGARHGECTTLLILGETYLKKGDLDAAMRHCLAAVEITDAIGHIDNSPPLLKTIAEIHYALGDMEKALEYLSAAIAITERRGHRRFQPNIHQRISEICEEIGDVARAFHHYKCAMTIRNEILNYETKRAIEQIQSRLQLERAEKEKKIALLKSQQLEQEISHRMRELSAIAMSLEERNNLIERLRRRIVGEMEDAEQDAGRLLDALLQEMALQPPPLSYQEFSRKIDESQHELNRLLTTRFPALTPAELRVCALLRGNMSTKEIADLLSVTTRNVETHRYHIRQKMKLPKDVNLITFLVSL